ncbi:neuronal acetylcholine receptor subunit alpha-10-like [Macrobrachium rosenbergii]|uniref:neuronal acetylcholine receptor subunit alpha-10-like n=1 Tax=Macrobrachium rosenbergii TaxID=79674 RepID=UPI0034D40C1C
MSNYNKHFRPIKKHGEITRVFFELSLFDIVSLDTRNQILISNTEMIMKWTDNYMQWNPAEYNGTTVVRVPHKDLWIPDIILQNTAQADYYSTILSTNAIVFSSGEVELVSHGIFQSICSVDTQYYPFDQQVCKLDFSSWTYDMKQIQLVPGPADLSKYNSNPAFFLENFFVTSHDVHNPCCEHLISTLTFTIQLQRRTVFSLFFFIMPGILINVCALMVFWLPADCGEKVGLGINALLAMIVFLMAMTENLPPTEKLPLAGVYYGSCISMIAANITATVFVLSVDGMGLKGYHVPEWLQVVTLFVAKITFIQIPFMIRESWELDDDDPIPADTDATQQSPVEVFTIEQDGLSPPGFNPPPPPPTNYGPPPIKEKKNSKKGVKGSKIKVLPFQRHEEEEEEFDYSTLKDATAACNALSLENLLNCNLSEACRIFDMNIIFLKIATRLDQKKDFYVDDPFEKRALKALESLCKMMKNEDRAEAKKELRSRLVDEWQFVARVLDKTFFILFTTVCFLFNVFILTSSPFRERFDYCPLETEGACDGMTFDQIKRMTIDMASSFHITGSGGISGGGVGVGGGH